MYACSRIHGEMAELVEGAPLLREYTGLNLYRGFESLPLRQPFPVATSPGEMAERPKAHAWKACVPKGTVGSNPTLSARATASAESLARPVSRAKVVC